MKEIELSNLFYIKKEIQKMREQLYELEQLAKYREGGFNIRKGKGGKPGDPTAALACEIADLKEVMCNKIKKLIKEQLKLEKIIGDISDPDLRLICRLRHTVGMSWEAIGDEVGYSESGVRKKYGRYFAQDNLF